MRATFIGLLLDVGASSGIGAGAAVRFASLGCRLALCGRNNENLQNVVKQCIDTGLPEEKVSIHSFLLMDLMLIYILYIYCCSIFYVFSLTFCLRFSVCW